MSEPPPGERSVEVVERKGIGHPDTICDALAEEVSRALSQFYLERFGMVLHHNVDKALLCGGEAAPRFGGGEVLAPIEIDLAGRVTKSFRGVSIPVEELAVAACQRWLRGNLHALDVDHHVRIRCRFRPGSRDLVELFARVAGGRVPLANDTSIGVGSAPRSPLERAVRDVERALTGTVGKEQWPEAGEDVKVMAVRQGEATAMTVACALVSRFVRDLDDYRRKKRRIAAALREVAMARLGPRVELVVNAADDPDRGSVYLTVTGTSAEAGDDGQVGRGNRVGGLITPGRPMTLEAAAGKNPVTHVGKIYSVAAGLIADAIVREVPGVTAADCLLVSRIGAPVDDPQLISLRVHPRDEGAPLPERAIEAVVRGVLGTLDQVARRFVEGSVVVF